MANERKKREDRKKKNQEKTAKMTEQEKNLVYFYFLISFNFHIATIYILYNLEKRKK